MNELLPCPGCRRHVRRNEFSCPFCSAALDLGNAELVLPRSRLGRAALFAFGATLAASLSTTACGSDDDGDGSGGTSGSGGSTGGSGGGATGGTAGSATGGTAGTGTGGEAGNAAGGFAGFSADYGTPPFDGG